MYNVCGKIGRIMFYVIAKPLKKKDRLHEEIKARLREAGIPFEFYVTEYKGAGKDLAARFTAEGESTLLVVGGDGTLNDVFSGIADPARCTLGLIPAGTGNDFAAVAKIPYGAAALDLILGKEPQYTDYLAFSDGRRSLNIAGIGIDVDILQRCERMKHFTARSKYFRSLLASLCKYRGAPMTVKADGLEAQGTFLISVVCNGRQFGGGIPIDPPAVIDDGKLELLYVDCPKRWKIPAALIKLMKGKVLSLPIAHFMQCEEAELIPVEPCVAQYDGELYKAESLNVKLIHREFKMFRG